MDIVNKQTGSYVIKDRHLREDSLDESYSYYPDGEHLHPTLNDKQEILPQDYERVRRKRKSRKVKKRVHLQAEMADQDNDEIPQEIVAVKTRPSELHTPVTGEKSIPMKNLGSKEKLQRIDQEVSRSTKSQKVDIRHLALQQAINIQVSSEKKRHCDYVLVHRTGDNGNTHYKLREMFEAILENEGFKIDKKYTTLNTFVILHCPFERLCTEAEYVALRMPLAGQMSSMDKSQAMTSEVIERSLLSRLKHSLNTDVNQVDFVSAPLCVSKRNIYEGIRKPDKFFRPALRSLLVNHIVTTVDIRDEECRELGQNPQGLPYMLLEGAYSDAFIVHEKSMLDKRFPAHDDGDDSTFVHGQDVVDPRRKLHQTWLQWFKFQPLWKIRNYFGEKIALYFAWLGSLTFSLIIPMLFGLAVTLWGLIVAIKEHPLGQKNTTTSEIITNWAKNAFDNSITPYFALVICLWGTIFLEGWKRLNARLAYKWDMDKFEEEEPNRPEFYGTEVRPDPITGREEPFYPFRKRCCKMSGSFSLLLFMVCLVLASLFGVIVYRIIARVDLFPNRFGALGPTIASVTSTFINTLSIMTMGKVYQILAEKLTDWENHRTQTLYDDALIIKLFGFQFVNSYTSLFYIAFFRQTTANKGILGFGSAYSDACGSSNDCMTLLSLQVAMLMILKPLPKLLSDVILPFCKRIWREHCCRYNRVEEADVVDHTLEDYLDCEMHKEPLGDFTLSEYTEKVLQYGFLMLFAAAFPLAPLIALLTNLIDMKIDARRMLWVNRRPIAFRAEDIGMWYGILEFLNIVGVVTNGFLVTFTSSYGKQWEGHSTSSVTNHTSINPVTNQTTFEQIIIQHPTFSRLWLLIGFEHIVFAFKFLIAWLIPDVPNDVSMAQRKEKHLIADILDKAGMRKGPGNRLTESSSTHQRKSISERKISNQQDQSSSAQSYDGQNIEAERSGNKYSHPTRETNAHIPEPDKNHFKTRLEPLPVSYLPNLGQLAVNANHKDV